MAGSKSDYLENAILNHVLRGVALPSPSAVYAALFTVAPSDPGGGVEVSGNGYARQAVTFTSASGGNTSNVGQVTFPAATPSGWGSVVAVGVFDAATAGNLLYWGTMASDVQIEVGDQAIIPFGQLAISEA